ncbi:Na+/H+ antiporter NhaA [Anaerolineales bacterium HSG6]|nr:Na+/H+ antiporter NhaA [Anaerolineales bacterium HSG6]
MSTDTKISSSASEPAIVSIMVPFNRFFHNEASSGVVLIACTVIALIWANSPFYHSYEELFHHMEFAIGFGEYHLSESLHFWINDGLMVIFFFVVGLEIKREVLAGELSEPRKAALPIAGAIGGMIVPAIIYTMFNMGGEGAAGWGIPMATDIAFAIGLLALLGDKAPLSLKVFLTALAIVDDLGAVLVIAVFYTTDLSFEMLAIGMAIFGLLILASRIGVRNLLVYTLLAIGLWLAFLFSGVHATIAGVLAAMAIPARTRLNSKDFIKTGNHLMKEFGKASADHTTVLSNRKQRAILTTLETACEQAETPLQRFENGLHLWVSFLIIPIFAIANAGVHLEGSIAGTLTNPIALGIMFGLVIGKQVGVTGAAWLAVKSGLAALPEGTTWKQVYAMSWLAGIGFTMSLFIAGLAFDGAHEELLTVAKFGVLVASLIAGVVGFIVTTMTATPPAAKK